MSDGAEDSMIDRLTFGVVFVHFSLGSDEVCEVTGDGRTERCAIVLDD